VHEMCLAVTQYEIRLVLQPGLGEQRKVSGGQVRQVWLNIALIKINVGVNAGVKV